MAITGGLMIVAGLTLQWLVDRGLTPILARQHPRLLHDIAILCAVAVLVGSLIVLLGFALHWVKARPNRETS
ncbi:MAG: hypothetical protein IT445_15175 [Phycisphaeraceae bacterium]|nr:hypothetical protein [Phycisphaeraceae bacterium]